MYLQVLYRIRAAPAVHLGSPSLSRLASFHQGYSQFPLITRTARYSSESFREWVLSRYWPTGGAAIDGIHALLEVAESDERAFDLFFACLDASSSATLHPLEEVPPRHLEGEPLAVSGYLDVLAERPGMFLRRVSTGCLRAFLDGYSLAAEEEGWPDCADLEGFDHWVRRQFRLRGMFRWEDALLAQFGGDEAAAFPSAVRELKAFRASKGPVSDRRYTVEHWKAPEQSPNQTTK